MEIRAKFYNFTKRPEVEVTKTTASGKSHGIRAVRKLSLMKNLKATHESLLNGNYSHLQFKERLPNEGYSTLVRKFEKRSSLSHQEDVKILQKTLIAM